MDIEKSLTVRSDMSQEQLLRGESMWKGHMSQQHEGAFQVFYDFLKIEKPNRILEIGTGQGGFTLSLRDCCDDLKLDIPIKSYDAVNRDLYDVLRALNVEIIVENIFKLEKGAWTDVQQDVVDYIQSEGKTVILCDGGHKPSEFKLFSERMKSGDFLLAHDYAHSYEVFEKEIKGKIWNWCEITEDDITQSCLENDLEDYDKEKFNGVAWGCKRKRQKTQ